MRIVEYKDLEWYVIKENEKEKLLLLKDSFTNDQIKKYFTNKEYIDSDYDVRFNKDYSNPWWRDSYIRQVLNTKFTEDLNINDLNIMEIDVELDGKKITTRDYVRLLTKEEVELLNIEILKTKREYGYWTMSPYSGNSSGYSRVFYVHGSSGPGYLYGTYVYYAYGVRPVVSLKSNAMSSDKTTSITNTLGCEEIEEVKRNATNKELADKLNELIRDRNKIMKRELSTNE